MIVDTSAVIALLRREPLAARIEDALAASIGTRMSAATYVELGIVVDRDPDPAQPRRADAILAAYGVAIEPVSVEQARVARAAYRDYGKGSGHPARLNLGDTFSYALASVTGEPLLFVGDDFTHTDITSALRPGAAPA